MAATLSCTVAAVGFALVGLLLSGVNAHPMRVQQETRKNILFFAVDDLRVELGAYGHSQVKTPNIDAFISKSLMFERAYCQVAVCSPSRASLLTGRRPDTNHVWKIAPDEYWRTFTNATSIPQFFKENGYISIGMGKIFHPGAPSGNDDEKYSWSPEGLPYYHAQQPTIRPRNSWESIEGATAEQLRDTLIGERAVSVLQELRQNRSRGDDRPFFLAVGFHKPHLPWYAPSQYYDMYPPASEIELPANPNADKNMPPIAWSTSHEIKDYPDNSAYNLPECYSDANASMFGSSCHFPDDKAREFRRAYYACVSYTDAQIGLVLKELANQNFEEETIIILWADHGWHLGEHNMWGKFTNLEDCTNVPLVLRVPGVTDAGSRTKALVELIDIFPTLADLAGVEVPPMCPEGKHNLLTCVEGSSFSPLLKNPDLSWKKGAFSQYARPQFAGLTQIPDEPPFNPANHGEDVMGYTVRVDKYRYTEWVKFNRDTAEPDWSNVWGVELYNHTEPVKFFDQENANIAKQPGMDSVVQELSQLLHAGWRAALPQTHAP